MIFLFKKLNYNLHETSNSCDISSGNNPTYQYQNQIIHKLNEEMQRLLTTLSHLDNECNGLKFQLNASRSEEAKSKLLGKGFF